MTTVSWITARGLFGRRRFLLLLPLPLLLVGLAVLARWAGVDPGEWATPVLVGLGLAVVLPVIALIVGTGVLGSEIDDGTLRAHPDQAAAALADHPAEAGGGGRGHRAGRRRCRSSSPGCSPTGVRLGLALAVASALGALAYSALFLALSLVTRRPVLLGLVYVLIWEGLLGNMVSGTRVLSVQQYVMTVADRIAPTALLDATVSLPVALVMSVVLTVGCTVLAIDRLRSFSVAGETS